MAKTSAAQLESVKRYQANLDRIVIQPPKAEGAAIRQAAADAGQSVQAYILDAVRQRMQDGEPEPQDVYTL